MSKKIAKKLVMMIMIIRFIFFHQMFGFFFLRWKALRYVLSLGLIQMMLSKIVLQPEFCLGTQEADHIFSS